MLDGNAAALIGLVGINVFWGASSIAAKEALLELNAVEICTIRFAIACAAVLAIALAFSPGALRISLRDVPLLIFLSVAGVSLQFVLQVTSLAYTTVTNFSLLFNMSTFFIMVLGALLLGERLTGEKLLGAGIAFAGLSLIVSGGSLDLSSSHLPGDLTGLASAALFGVYTIAMKRAACRYRPLTILAYTFLFGVIGLLPFYMLGTPMTPPADISPLSWAALLFLALCCSVIAFLVYNHGVGKLRASEVGMTIYVTPLAGVALAVVLLGEPLTALTVTGAALIMMGMYVSRSRDAGPAPEPPAEAAAPVEAGGG
jgi:drug/metabolite transporter (DMT)-like permease